MFCLIAPPRAASASVRIVSMPPAPCLVSPFRASPVVMRTRVHRYPFHPAGSRLGSAAANSAPRPDASGPPPASSSVTYTLCCLRSAGFALWCPTSYSYRYASAGSTCRAGLSKCGRLGSYTNGGTVGRSLASAVYCGSSDGSECASAVPRPRRLAAWIA
jgi:hypothetical protein